jgi:hypothetical protein
MVSEDIVKLVVDYGMSTKKSKKDIDVGLWRCIYKNGKPTSP